jgi:hypothetical protein
MIYIAGPITAIHPDIAKTKFQQIENELHALDLKVINPLKLGIPYSWSHAEQLKECKRVITKDATAIYFMRGWKNSEGCREEFEHVDALNKLPTRRILVYYEDEFGLSSIRRDIRNKELTCLIDE